MSKTRRFLAGALIAGLATVGGAGVAYAQSGQGTTNPGHTATAQEQEKKFCEKWVPRLPKLEDFRERSERRIDQLQKAIEKARDHHREDLVERLEKRLDKVQRAHDRVVDLINRIHARCDAH